MPQRRRMTVLAAVIALVAAGPAVPSALAQSAGDEQYEDPFAGQDPGGAEEEPQPTPGPESPTPVPEAPASTAPEPQPVTPTPEPASQSQPELPRTGLEAAPILAIGAVLLGGGIALRVRLRERS